MRVPVLCDDGVTATFVCPPALLAGAPSAGAALADSIRKRDEKTRC